VEALVAGHIQVAWNSPLAWLQTERIARKLGQRAEAICMRDTDRGLVSVIVTRESGPVRSVGDLKGRRVAVGAKDSPQATLIPLYHLSQQGVEPHRDFEVLLFDRLVGKHGDHIGGERDAARALVRGDCDAACLLDGNLLLFAQEGTLPAGSVRTLATTPEFDHCNFTVMESGMSPAMERFRQLLLGMSYEDPEVRRLLDLEGLKRWLPGRTEGYDPLTRAVDHFGYLDEFTAAVAARCT
jgi:ABC-type phosphate/phosphonate transport system substrate-binding protein